MATVAVAVWGQALVTLGGILGCSSSAIVHWNNRSCLKNLWSNARSEKCYKVLWDGVKVAHTIRKTRSCACQQREGCLENREEPNRVDGGGWQRGQWTDQVLKESGRLVCTISYTPSQFPSAGMDQHGLHWRWSMLTIVTAGTYPGIRGQMYLYLRRLPTAEIPLHNAR